MIRKSFLGFPVLVLICIFSLISVASADNLPVVGYVENVRIFLSSDHIVRKAKIDTGAKTSSLDVDGLSIYSRKGSDWVSFLVKNEDGEQIKVELPIERSARIRRAGAEKDERPVVKLGLCLGRFYKEGEVNLSERDGMNYKMLIGRRFLSGSYLVNSGKKFLQKKPRCKKR